MSRSRPRSCRILPSSARTPSTTGHAAGHASATADVSPGDHEEVRLHVRRTARLLPADGAGPQVDAWLHERPQRAPASSPRAAPGGRPSSAPHGPTAIPAPTAPDAAHDAAPALRVPGRAAANEGPVPLQDARPSGAQDGTGLLLGRPGLLQGAPHRPLDHPCSSDDRGYPRHNPGCHRHLSLHFVDGTQFNGASFQGCLPVQRRQRIASFFYLSLPSVSYQSGVAPYKATTGWRRLCYSFVFLEQKKKLRKRFFFPHHRSLYNGQGFGTDRESRSGASAEPQRMCQEST